jgi:hypothetical protein
VLAILCGIPLAVIFAFVALSRIKRSGQGGRGLAIAGLAVSAAWVLLFAALIAIGASQEAPRDSAGVVTRPASVDVDDLKKGDCIVAVPEGDGSVRDIDVTPCTSPHRAEVYATFDLPGGEYPGTTRASDLADEGCGERAPTIDSTAGGELDIFFVYPQRGSWALGDRSVTCFVATTTPVTSTIVP